MHMLNKYSMVFVGLKEGYEEMGGVEINTRYDRN